MYNSLRIKRFLCFFFFRETRKGFLNSLFKFPKHDRQHFALVKNFLPLPTPFLFDPWWLFTFGSSFSFHLIWVLMSLLTLSNIKEIFFIDFTRKTHKNCIASQHMQQHVSVHFFYKKIGSLYLSIFVEFCKTSTLLKTTTRLLQLLLLTTHRNSRSTEANTVTHAPTPSDSI